MPVNVRTHIRRRPRREHPRGPVLNVKLRRQDAYYVIGTLMGDEATFSQRVRDRAVQENRMLTDDEKMEIAEMEAINARIKDTIRKAVERRKG